jgi:hypothetical protein
MNAFISSVMRGPSHSERLAARAAAPDRAGVLANEEAEAPPTADDLGKALDHLPVPTGCPIFRSASFGPGSKACSSRSRISPLQRPSTLR